MARIRLNRQEAEEGDLPPLCMRCGAPARDFVLRSFTWWPVWTTMMPLFRMSRTKYLTSMLPFCAEHREQPLFSPYWTRIRAAEITDTTITLDNASQDFVDALWKHREKRRTAGYSVEEKRTLLRRRRATAEEATRPLWPTVRPWVLGYLGCFILVPMVFGGIVLAIMMMNLHAQRFPPGGPPDVPRKVKPGPARPEHVAAMAVSPDAGFPAALPWAALLFVADPSLPKPLNDAEIESLLRDLKSGDVFRCSDAASKLQKAVPDERRRQEIASSLEPWLRHPHLPVREATLRAFAVWGGPEQVLPLLQAVNAEPFPNTRALGIETLKAIAQRSGGEGP